MAGERKIVGLWPVRGEQTRESASALAMQVRDRPDPPPETSADEATPERAALWDDSGIVAAPDRRAVPWAALVLGMVGIAWTGAYAFTVSEGFERVPAWNAIVPSIGALCAPLALLLLGWIAIDRGSERSMQRHLRLLGAMRAEQQGLADRLAMVDRQWDTAQERLASRARDFASQLTDAGQRIAETGAQVEARMQTAVELGTQVNEAGDRARRTMDGLTIVLPKAEEIAKRAAEGMRDAGQTAYQLGGQLEERIAAIHAEAHEAEARIDRASTSLLAHTGAIAEASELAQQAADQAGAGFAAALGAGRVATLAMLADLAAQMDASTRELEQQLGTIRGRMETAAAAQVALMNTRLTDTEQRIGAIEDAASGIVARTADAGAALEDRAERLASGLAAFEAESNARLRALEHGFGTIDIQLDGVRSRCVTVEAASEALLQRAEACVRTLAAATQEVDAALPQALQRLLKQAAEARTGLADLPPLFASSADAAGLTVARLREADGVLEQHAAALTALDRTASSSMAVQASALGALQGSIGELGEALRHLRDDAAPELAARINALENSTQRATAAIEAAVAEAARASAEAVEMAIGAAVEAATGDGVAGRVAALVSGAEGAVVAANAASERLMRQMITIADTSAAIEARVAENSAAVAGQDRDSLARQFALASEALQSASVDLTRILSVEVSDQAWEAYLRGDRGIFARRAVKLLTGAEARDVLNRYESDEAFRGLVNRYVHDFEAMLRSMMDTRDGPALSATLLSSDIGKVYVALAQGIERLRG